MPIFISHTTKDNEIAQNVYWRLLYTHGIVCYIDDMDKELGKNRGKSKLTPLLIDRLRKCDTLLAIITENTKGSWWVPFEIGTAREMPRVISSFTLLPEESTYNRKEVLPEYLLEWPRLRSDYDLDVFAREYKMKQSLLIEKTLRHENFSQGQSPENDVRDFEISIMNALGQRSY